MSQEFQVYELYQMPEVIAELAKMHVKDRQNISSLLALLANGTKPHKMPHVKPVVRGLYEARYVGKPNNVRALFSYHEGKLMVVATVFVKKDEALKRSDIERALNRLEEYKE